MPVDCQANQAMPGGLIAPLQRIPGEPDGKHSMSGMNVECTADTQYVPESEVNRSQD